MCDHDRNCRLVLFDNAECTCEVSEIRAEYLEEAAELLKDYIGEDFRAAERTIRNAK